MSPINPAVLSNDQYKALKAEITNKKSEFRALIQKKLSDPAFDDQGRIVALQKEFIQWKNVTILIDESHDFNPIHQINFPPSVPKG